MNRETDVIISEGIIAKIVSFIVEKSAGKAYFLATDKRKQACRSLTKLYFCLQSLDEVTDAFLKTFDDFRSMGRGESLFHAVNNHSRDIELASNMFIDLSRELEEGLELIDPALAKCCHLLYWGKFDFLYYLSTSIETKRVDKKWNVVLKRPLKEIESVDMEAMYSQTKAEMKGSDRFYWPDSAFSQFSEQFEDVVVTAEDVETAALIYDMLKRQNMLLKEAKEALRVLIKESFSVEEILFQTDSHPYR